MRSPDERAGIERVVRESASGAIEKRPLAAYFAFQMASWRSKSRKLETTARSIPSSPAASRIASAACAASLCKVQPSAGNCRTWVLARPVSSIELNIS